jgi:outer membrane protein TolC
LSLPFARRVGLLIVFSLPAFAEAPARQLESWNEAVALFSQHSTDARIAAQEVVRAGGRRRTALGALLPQVNGSALASFSLLQPPAGTDEATAALYGSAPYQSLGLVAQLSVVDVRGWNAVFMAHQAEDVAKLTNADAQRLLLVNLAQALMNVVAAEKTAELNASGVSDSQSRLELAEKSEKAGVTTTLDVARLRQDFALAKSNAVMSDEAVRQARETLGIALGVDEPVGVSPSFSLDGLAAHVPERCRAVADLDARPDVRAAKQSMNVARRGVMDVDAQFIPSVAVRMNAQAFIIQGTAIPIWNVQAVLTVPIWDGGMRYGALRDAKAVEKQVEARTENAVRRARVEVDRARRAIEVATATRAQAEEALKQAELTDTLTKKAWDAGAGTSLELVTAASSLRAQRLQLALRDYDVLRARVVALFVLSECNP